MKTFRGIMEVSSQVCIGDIFNPNLVFDTSKGIYKCYVEEENAEIKAIYLIKEGYKNPEITNNYSIILSPSTFIGFFNDDYSTKKAQNIKKASQYELPKEYVIENSLKNSIINLPIVTLKYFVACLKTKNYVLYRGKHGFKIAKLEECLC